MTPRRRAHPSPTSRPYRGAARAIRVCGFRDATMVAHYRLAIGPLLAAEREPERALPSAARSDTGSYTATVLTRPFSRQRAAVSGHGARTATRIPMRFPSDKDARLIKASIARSKTRHERATRDRCEAGILQYFHLTS